MADDNVVVSFSTDLSGLEAGIAAAKAQIASFNSDVTNLGRQATAAATVANDVLKELARGLRGGSDQSQECDRRRRYKPDGRREERGQGRERLW